MLSVKRVVAAVSGGVDSAVAALMLKRMGADVCGVFMKESHDDDGDAAEMICRRIGIPFSNVSIRDEYQEQVVTHAVESCQRGITPDPEIITNKALRLGWFLRYSVDEMGADAIATGHYARTLRYGEDVALLRSIDPAADQTLALSQVTQESLRRVMFPLGSVTRSEAVTIAAENKLEGLTTRRRNQTLQDVIDAAKTPTQLINVNTDEVVGEYSIHRWMVGEQIDATVGYLLARYGSAYLVSPNVNHPLLFSHMFGTDPPHWIRPGTDPEPILECHVSCSRLKRPVRATVVPLRSGDLVVSLERPIRGMHPGQFVAFYSGDECLGSARLKTVGPSCYSLKNPLPDELDEYTAYSSYR